MDVLNIPFDNTLTFHLSIRTNSTTSRNNGLDENSTKSLLLLEIEMEAPESHKTLKAEHKAAKADGNAKTLWSEGLVDKAS